VISSLCSLKMIGHNGHIYSILAGAMIKFGNLKATTTVLVGDSLLKFMQV
jgi:hypothetical protein